MKTQRNNASVEAFLEAVPNLRHRDEGFLLLEMMKRLTGFAPVMWGGSIVGFGNYSYTNAQGRKQAWFLTGFSPRKQAMSVYIIAGFDRFEKQLAELGKHKTGLFLPLYQHAGRRRYRSA